MRVDYRKLHDELDKEYMELLKKCRIDSLQKKLIQCIINEKDEHVLRCLDSFLGGIKHGNGQER